MEVQETNIKTRMKSFHRVTTKHKSYYPCKKSLETRKPKFCSVRKMGRPSACTDFLLFPKKILIG